MSTQYVHKPTEVEAVQLTKENFNEVCAFIEAAGLQLNDGTMESEGYIGFKDSNDEDRAVRTGDYVIKGVNGIVYPCTEAVFTASYDVKA